MKLLRELVALTIGRVAPLWQMLRPLLVQTAVALSLEVLFALLFRPITSDSTEIVVAS